VSAPQNTTGVYVKAILRFSLAAAMAASAPVLACAEWQAVEKVQTYAISGKTGADLYASIGEHGPKLGAGRTIAHTSFKLTWRRQYVPNPDACVLESAVPKLIITYTIPKPTSALPAPLRSSWETFIAGVKKHELVHGESIKRLVREIEQTSVGLSAPDDPDCRKIRIELTKRLAELSQQQRQRDSEFDRVEMSDGGNIQQLILALANGP
jgi:predicted secreted Zn-dependent protease